MVVEDSGLLGCATVLLGEWLLMLPRIVVASSCGSDYLTLEDEGSTFSQTVSNDLSNNDLSNDALLHPRRPESSCLCLSDGQFFCYVILEVLTGETMRM
jgi:hypothetical protein